MVFLLDGVLAVIARPTLAFRHYTLFAVIPIIGIFENQKLFYGKEHIYSYW